MAINTGTEFKLANALGDQDAAKDIVNNVNTLISLVDGIAAPELGFLDGVTAGTVTASKAVVVDSNKDAGDFRNLDAVNFDAGASGTAGTVDIFPSTASKGKVSLTAADSAGNTTTTIVNASQSGARTYTIPDAGGSASFMMAAGTNTLSGATATNIVALTDNLADALSYKESSSFYLTFVTTDNAESVAVGKRLTTTDGVSSGTAKIVGGMAYSGVSSSDTVTAATSNNSFVAFASTYTIPANTLKAGTIVRIRALVSVNDASGSDTLTCELRIGGTSLIATTAVNPGATTDHHILEFDFLSRAAPSASSSCVGYGVWGTNTGGTMATASSLLAATNFATNGTLAVDVRAKWSSNTANTSARLEMLNVEII